MAMNLNEEYHPKWLVDTNPNLMRSTKGSTNQNHTDTNTKELFPNRAFICDHQIKAPKCGKSYGDPYPSPGTVPEAAGAVAPKPGVSEGVTQVGHKPSVCSDLSAGLGRFVQLVQFLFFLSQKPEGKRPACGQSNG